MTDAYRITQELINIKLGIDSKNINKFKQNTFKHNNMNNNNNTYGVMVNGEYTDVSNSLLGAKQYATRNGYNEVYKRHNNGYVVRLVTAKVTNKWVNQS